MTTNRKVNKIIRIWSLHLVMRPMMIISLLKVKHWMSTSTKPVKQVIMIIYQRKSSLELIKIGINLTWESAYLVYSKFFKSQNMYLLKKFKFSKPSLIATSKVLNLLFMIRKSHQILTRAQIQLITRKPIVMSLWMNVMLLYQQILLVSIQLNTLLPPKWRSTTPDSDWMSSLYFHVST